MSAPVHAGIHYHPAGPKAGTPGTKSRHPRDQKQTPPTHPGTKSRTPLRPKANTPQTSAFWDKPTLQTSACWDTPPPPTSAYWDTPPVDSYCSGRYASYWNAFFLFMFFCFEWRFFSVATGTVKGWLNRLNFKGKTNRLKEMLIFAILANFVYFPCISDRNLIILLNLLQNYPAHKIDHLPHLRIHSLYMDHSMMRGIHSLYPFLLFLFTPLASVKHGSVL